MREARGRLVSDDAPAVSIAVRAFRRRWLGDAIGSVLRQTYSDLELVVYDDAGDLAAVVDEFADPRVRYHRAGSKRGPSGRFAAAVALCRGRYIGVLDDDDRYEPSFVERLVEALEDDERAGIALCRVMYDVDGAIYVPPDPRPAGTQPDALREILAYRVFVPPSVMLVRRAALDASNARRPMPDGVAPDAWLNVHAAAEGWRHVLVDERLAVRRWHDDRQISTSGLAAAHLTVSTWEQLAVSDAELERLRRHVLARKLVWRATYELAARNRAAARADASASAYADGATWRLPRALVRAAACVPTVGPLAARFALGLMRANMRRAGPPSLARPPRPLEQIGRDAAALGVGTAGAQILLVAVAPILTRLYAPAELGAASVLVGIMAAAGVVACLRLDVAIPLAAARAEAAALCVLSLLAGGAVAALLAVAVAAAGGDVAALANVPELGGWTWLVPLHAAVAALGLTGAGILLRRRRFGPLGRLRLAHASGQSIWQIGAGAAGAGAPGFAAGATVGMGAYATAAAVATVARVSAGAATSPRERLRDVVRRWGRFAAWSTVAALLSAAAFAFLPLVVAALYGPAAAGLFVLAQRVLAWPVTIAGEAVASAWFGTAAEIVRERQGALRQPLVAVTRALVVGGGVFFVLAVFAGPPLFPTIFGEDWRGAGELLAALAPLHFFLLVAIPAGQALQALGRTDLLTAVAAARLAAGVGGIPVAHALGWPLTMALGLYAGLMASISLAIAIVAWRLAASLPTSRS